MNGLLRLAAGPGSIRGRRPSDGSPPRWSIVALAGLLTLSSHLAAADALTVAPAAVTFPGATLDGSDLLMVGSTSAWQVDATGEAGGWNLTIASTDLESGSHTIPVGGFETRLLDANIVVVSGDPTGPSSTQTSFTSLSAVPLKLASATSGNGDGIYDATPDFQLAVPAETHTGSYTATLTVDVAAGP